MPGERRAVGAQRFRLTVGGMEVGRFTEVAGLQVERQVEEVKEGGHQGIHRLPGGLTHPNLVLSRGVTDDDVLLGWLRETESALDASGTLERRDGTISLLDARGATVREWSFTDAFPVRWSGPTLAAAGTETATETLEISHAGFW